MLLSLVNSLVKKEHWRPGACIDVGANYGEFSAAVTLWWFIVI